MRKRIDEPQTADEYVAESTRYLENARGILREAPRVNGLYRDRKVVQKACGVAYIAVLYAIRGFLLNQGVHRSKLPESYDAYCQALARHTARNGKVKDLYYKAYDGLHLDGYYRGTRVPEFVHLWFGFAQQLIARLAGRSVAGA